MIVGSRAGTRAWLLNGGRGLGAEPRTRSKFPVPVKPGSHPLARQWKLAARSTTIASAVSTWNDSLGASRKNGGTVIHSQTGHQYRRLYSRHGFICSTSIEASDFRAPAISRTDLDLARTRIHPSGRSIQVSRVPGFAPSAVLTAAGTVVRPLPSILDCTAILPDIGLIPVFALAATAA